MSEFALGWSNEHDLSEPLTGALFDLMMDVYQAALVERGLIPPSFADFVDGVGHLRAFAPIVQADYDRHYPRDPQGFRLAFLDARDLVGRYFARTLSLLAPDGLTYAMVERALLHADGELGRGRFAAEIRNNFAWREIGRIAPGPYLGGQRGTNALSRRPASLRQAGSVSIAASQSCRALALGGRHGFAT